MKTIRISSISYVALLLIASLTSCKKAAEPNPELSARVVGNYTLTGLRANDKLYTVNAQTTGKMSVVRESATSVQMTVDVTTASPTDNIHFTATGVSLQEVGNGEVDMIKDGNSFAKGGNNTLTIKIAPTDGSTPYQLIGTK